MRKSGPGRELFNYKTARICSCEREFQLGVNGRYEIFVALKRNIRLLAYKSVVRANIACVIQIRLEKIRKKYSDNIMLLAINRI